MPIPPMLNTPRAAIMAVFGAFGAGVGAVAGAMPTITRASGVDSFALGLGITGSMLASMLVMSYGGLIARHASNRAILLWSLPCFAVLTMGLLTSASFAVFMVAFILQGFVIGLTDIFMNAEGVAIEHDVGKPILTMFHGSVSVGLPVFAILSSFVSIMIGPWATGLCVGAAFAVAWIMVYRLVPARALASGHGSRIASIANKTPLVILGLAAGLMVAGEITAILWSAKLLDEQAPHLAAIAGLGAAFYGACNALVRLPGDRLRAYFGDLPLMLGSLVVAIAGFAALGLSQSFALSVAAFALVGLGTAVLTPCVFTLAARFVPANRAAGLGFVSMIAGGPRILAPWIFGWIASVTSISGAFGLFAGLLIVALLLILALQRITRLT